jgi:hypothetical protein
MSFEQVTRRAKETTLRDGGHVPMVIAEGTRQHVMLQIAGLAPRHEARVRQLYIAGAVVARDGRVGRLRRVFFISEGWMSVAREGQLPEVPPTQDPQRKEVLVVSSYEVDFPLASMALFEMVRDGQGVLRELRDVGVTREGGEEAYSPLLEAFVYGFASAGPVY